MSLITPDFGLFFWMVLAFGVLLFVMKKFAWKPILGGLRSREESIASALAEAEAARGEVAALQARQLDMQREAQADRDRLVAEARATRDAILAQAREEARRQTETLIADARERMRMESEEQRKRMRDDVVRVAILAAERVLRDRLSTQEAQRDHLDRILDEVLS